MVAFVEVVPSVLRSRVELSTGGVDPLTKITVTIGGLPVYALRICKLTCWIRDGGFKNCYKLFVCHYLERLKHA